MKHNFQYSMRVPVAVALLFATTALTACSNDTTEPKTGTAATVAVSTAPPASAEVATAVTGPSVVVTGSGGQPVAGVQVTFAVTGGGAVQFPVATTNEQGIASAGLWQVGPKVGANKVTATVAGLAPVEFNLASAAGPASAIGVNGGSGQSGAPSSALATPLSVRITDAGGNSKPGVAVTFSVVSGGGSIAGATATTNAGGIATSGTWTLGAGQCVQNARATAGTLTSNFTASSRGTITNPGTQAGTLGSTDCVIDGAPADEYDLTTAAEAITVSMTSAAFNPVVDIVTADGTALSAQATGSGGTASFRMIGAAGSKAVRATAATASAAGAYTVSVAGTSSDVTDCTPMYIEMGASTTQTLTTSDCTVGNRKGVNGDVFLVYLTAGVPVRITQTSLPLDALTELWSPAGVQLVERDNAGVNAATPEIINFTPTTSGFYRIVATSYGLVYNDPYTTSAGSAQYGAYTLSVIKP